MPILGMVLLLTDVFLLLTQVLLWLVVGLIIWFVLARLLPRPFLGLLVLLLILIILGLSFLNGPPRDGGVLEILWRIISFPLTPAGLLTILLAALLSGTKLSKLARNLLLLGLIVLALGSIPIVSYALAQELEFEGIELIRPQPALTPGARSVIVLLGQGTTDLQLRTPRNTAPTNPPRVERPITPEAFQVLTQLPIQLTTKGDRIIYAAQLYREETQRGTGPLIIVSAPPRPGRIRKENETREEVSEARDIQTMLTQTFNVPATDVLLEIDSTNTRNSAERIRDLLANRRINFGNQLTLVTTAMSMNRAFLTFGGVFPDRVINARPTDFRTLPSSERLVRLARGRDLIDREILVTDFLPTAESFCLASEVFEEYLSALYYFLRGWIRPFQPINVISPTPVAPASPTP